MKDDLREEVTHHVLQAEGFGESVKALLAIIARERDAAIAAARPVIEREATAAIVAWLCDPANIHGPHLYLADAIERGEYLLAKPLDT